MLSYIHRLTSGNIFTELVKFAIPFLIANFLVSMYGAVDILIVGYYSDAIALSATAVGAQVILTVMTMAIGLGLGGTILIGQYFGAKRDDDVLETIGTQFVLFGVLSVLCSLCMVLMAAPITDWMKTPMEARDATINYIRICGIGLIFTFMYETISSVLRGLGDSKNPLKFIAIACVINVLLDLLFIGCFQWGASGAAAATVIAQGLSFIIGIVYLRRHQFIFDFKWHHFKFIPKKAKMILKLGIPTAIQEGMVQISFDIMSMVVNKFGVAASAVFGITNRIDNFMFLPALAFGSAISVMAAQNMGANKIQRAKESFYVGFLLSLIFAVPAFLMTFMWPEQLMRLVVASDEQIITLGGNFMYSYSITCLLWALIFCIDGFLNGCGRTTFTMVNSLFCSVAIRIPLFLIATTLFAIGFSVPVSAMPQVLVSLFYFYMGWWKKRIITPQKDFIS